MDEETDTERNLLKVPWKWSGESNSSLPVPNHLLIVIWVGTAVVVWLAKFANISTKLKPYGFILGFALVKMLRGREGPQVREALMGQALCTTIISNVHSNHEMGIILSILWRDDKMQCSIVKGFIQGLVAELGFEPRILWFTSSCKILLPMLIRDSLNTYSQNCHNLQRYHKS